MPDVLCSISELLEFESRVHVILSILRYDHVRAGVIILDLGFRRVHICLGFCFVLPAIRLFSYFLEYLIL